MSLIDEMTWKHEIKEPREELENYVKIANRLFMKWTVQQQHPDLIQRAQNIEYYIRAAIKELEALEPVFLEEPRY